jgi:hypothetical protein
MCSQHGNGFEHPFSQAFLESESRKETLDLNRQSNFAMPAATRPAIWQDDLKVPTVCEFPWKRF